VQQGPGHGEAHAPETDECDVHKFPVTRGWTYKVPLVSGCSEGGAVMKAIRVLVPGGPEVLRYEDVPTPTPQAGQVLVQVEAAGVNFIDT